MDRSEYLRFMDIPEWQLRREINKHHSSWESLSKQITQCQLCDLAHSRKNTVFGVGNPKAEVVFIGEAPGATEDRLGEPFVGRAGKLLDKMLFSIGLDRQSVFITNVLKCRPPQNRDPKAQEVSSCTPYLEQQLEFIQPKLLVALGRISANYLLGVKTPLSQLRGQAHRFANTGIPLYVTYHPAYLLRQPKDKKKAYQDLCQIKSSLE